MKLEDYIPEQFDDRHYKVLIKTLECSACGCRAVPQLRSYYPHSPFPTYYLANFEAQIARAGIRLIGSYPDGGPLCVDCSKAGKATFVCALCGQKRTTDLKHESFGSPSEYLCEPCYEVTPAKAWDAKVKELEDSHKHDFE